MCGHIVQTNTHIEPQSLFILFTPPLPPPTYGYHPPTHAHRRQDKDRTTTTGTERWRRDRQTDRQHRRTDRGQGRRTDRRHRDRQTNSEDRTDKTDERKTDPQHRQDRRTQDWTTSTIRTNERRSNYSRHFLHKKGSAMLQLHFFLKAKRPPFKTPPLGIKDK